MRIAFAGTPPFAAQALSALVAAGHDIALVLTQPDRPAGRGLRLQASAVKSLALSHGMAVAQPRSLRLDGRYPEAAQAARLALQAAAPQVMVVAAYGLILPLWVLQLPAQGCLNIHASLLPRWRGAAPIQRAIEAGDTTTGITIMQMDEGLDTGDMLLAQSENIRLCDTSASLHERLAELGARMIVRSLDEQDALHAARQKQPDTGVCYAHKLDKAEGAIDWHVSAAALERKVRAFDPAPGCTLFGPGALANADAVAGASASTPLQTVKLWSARACAAQDLAARAGSSLRGASPGQIVLRTASELVVACSEGALSLLSLQASGGKRLAVADFLHTPAARTWLPGAVFRLDA